MEFIVCSDNHGSSKTLDALRKNYPEVTLKIHCGDSEMPPEALDSFLSVNGNCDYMNFFPNDRIIEFEGIRIYVTHGHLLQRSDPLYDLAIRAQAYGCEMACTGHTHRFIDEVIEGVRILNPGSLAYNRDGSKQSYALCSIDENKDIHITRCAIEDIL